MSLRPVPAGYNSISAQATVSYGTSAVQLNPAVACDAVIIIPEEANTGVTYWGGLGVTVDTGIPLAAWPDGDIIPINSTGKIYLISDQASQEARFTALKG